VMGRRRRPSVGLWPWGAPSGCDGRRRSSVGSWVPGPLGADATLARCGS